MTGDPGQRTSWQGLGYLRKEAEAEAGTKSQRLFLSPLPSLSSQQHDRGRGDDGQAGDASPHLPRFRGNQRRAQVPDRWEELCGKPWVAVAYCLLTRATRRAGGPETRSGLDPFLGSRRLGSRLALALFY